MIANIANIAKKLLAMLSLLSPLPETCLAPSSCLQCLPGLPLLASQTCSIV